VVLTSAITRSSALAYHLELASNRRQRSKQWCESKGRCVRAPPHGRKDRTHTCSREGGDDNTAIGGAEIGIVGAEALLPTGDNTSTVQRLATAWCCAAPAVSWHCMSATNTVVAISAAVKSCAWPAASLLLADVFAANAVPRSADSQQQRSLARDLPADTSACAAAAWQVVFTNAGAANAEACPMDSWQWHSLVYANAANT
jgi:hypothetical protein